MAEPGPAAERGDRRTGETRHIADVGNSSQFWTPSGSTPRRCGTLAVAPRVVSIEGFRPERRAMLLSCPARAGVRPERRREDPDPGARSHAADAAAPPRRGRAPDPRLQAQRRAHSVGGARGRDRAGDEPDPRDRAPRRWTDRQLDGFLASSEARTWIRIVPPAAPTAARTLPRRGRACHAAADLGTFRGSRWSLQSHQASRWADWPRASLGEDVLGCVSNLAGST